MGITNTYATSALKDKRARLAGDLKEAKRRIAELQAWGVCAIIPEVMGPSTDRPKALEVKGLDTQRWFSIGGCEWTFDRDATAAYKAGIARDGFDLRPHVVVGHLPMQDSTYQPLSISTWIGENAAAAGAPRTPW